MPVSIKRNSKTLPNNGISLSITLTLRSVSSGVSYQHKTNAKACTSNRASMVKKEDSAGVLAGCWIYSICSIDKRETKKSPR